MRARLRRSGVLRLCGNRLHHIFNCIIFNGVNLPVASVIVTAAVLTGVTLAGALPGHAGDERAGTGRVDTEHLFGFVEGADIGSKGEAEFLTDTSLRAGKGAGSFTNTASDVELKYTAFQNFRLSAGATLAYYDIAGMSGIADIRHAAIQALFADTRFLVLDRAQAPFGLTLSVSPHWGLADETSGVPTRHFGAEIKLLADRVLAPDRIAGAVNLLFANDRARLRALDGIEHESLLGGGVALAAQIRPGLWLGGEARYLRDYSGAALNVFAGQAVYAGPTVYLQLGGKAFASAALEFQVWGGAAAAPGALDLTNFERVQAKLRFGVEF
jgi:hypothetical protein